MGPRQRSRGRRLQTMSDAFTDLRLQWGHDKGVVEGEAYLIPRRNNTLKLQWGHDKGVVEGEPVLASGPVCPGCFNGATTKESWKARDRVEMLAKALAASMGPRQRSRGRRLLRRPPCHR